MELDDITSSLRVNPPPGCKFSDRCPSFMEGKCDVKLPELLEAKDGRLVACYLYGG